MKKIMILGASELQVPLIRQAKLNGYKTVVVSPQVNDPGFNFADYCIFEDVCNKEVILSRAKEINIKGVITDQTDIPVRTAAFIAEKLKLPGIGFEKSMLFTNKFLMREKCKELEIPTLNYQLVENPNEAIYFLKQLGGEAIIKPLDNQGSRGVYKVSNPFEIEKHFDECLSYSKEKKVLIEEFVTGRELVIEGISFNYEFKNLICGDTHYFNLPNVFSATTRVFPSVANPKLVERALELNHKIISGFGLKQGITHSEFIMKGNDLFLIETAARGGGVFISSDLIKLSTGLNTEDFLIKIATGTQKSWPYFEKTNSVCCYIAFFLPVGEVLKIRGLNEIESYSFTHRHNLSNLKVGYQSKPFLDKTARKFIIVSAANHNELMKNVSQIKTKLEIEVQTINGIQGPIWS